MNKQHLKVIERAIRSNLNLFPLNTSWAYLHKHYNIGRTQGNKLEINQQDKDDLLALVKAEMGIDLTQSSCADFMEMNREAVLAMAIDEKLAGRAVKQARLAIRSSAGKPLKINGHSYSLPEPGFLDLGLVDIHSSAHNFILVVENFPCFDHLTAMRLDLPGEYADPLVVFRGDNYYSQQTVRLLLSKLALPVLVMADLDPQGLMIVQSFTNVAGLIAPSLADLEVLFKDKRIANPQLYDKQLMGCQTALANSPYRLIRQLWQMMHNHQAGIVQEHGLLTACAWTVHRLDSAFFKE
ncbi:MAG: hypothetical protein NTV43_09425 [Methylococcales bacterium]|nr:hypothetical protein [Methylococcales bacterium]